MLTTKEHKIFLSFVHLRAASNWPLRTTVRQNSSSVQMAAVCHVGAAVLVHVALSGRSEPLLDERSLGLVLSARYERRSLKLAI